ncbi:hypothetical protein COO60DRAFT_1062102 [Scenedesmus sp. NREL 46B-D3]|nr:hypothetical protein COO60DRAFT_1062102 [Scenedesmus sp. NREL 46B-D3]
MRSRGHSQQYLLGLGAAGAVAVLAASVVAVAVTRRRKQPYSKAEWEAALEEIGEIRGFDAIVDRIADEGLEPSIRPDVWPFLLEVFDPASCYQQRQAQHQLMLRQYQQLLLQCQAYEAALKESLRPSSPSAAGSGLIQQQQQQQQVKPPGHQHQHSSCQSRCGSLQRRIASLSSTRSAQTSRSTLLA